MHDEIIGPSVGRVTIDAFSDELRALRSEAGSPSYAAIAAEIAARREAAGMSAERARIARSTVYDVFRTGRRRLDVGLVREVLVALGLSEDSVEAWVSVARRATPDGAEDGATSRRTSATSLPTASTHVFSVAVPTSAPPPTAALATSGETTADGESETSDEASIDPAAAVVAPRAHRPSRQRSLKRIAVILLACVGINLVGRGVVLLLDLPLHLDMTGTAVSAILLGPWWGALVGVATNTSGVLLSGVNSLPFALVNVTGALVWGYGVRHFGMGRSIPRFFSLNVICAAACSVVAVPIVYLLDDTLRHASTSATDHLVAITHLVLVSTFVSNLVISIFDKSISGFAALAIVESRTPVSSEQGAGPGRITTSARLDPGSEPHS